MELKLIKKGRHIIK